MIVRVSTFRGMMNAASPRLIPDEQATHASNCITRTGDLTPFGGIGDIVGGSTLFRSPDLVGNAQSLYLYDDQYWFSWAKPVHAIPSPIAEDPHQRVYFTGDGVPKYTNASIATGAGALPFASYELGIDAPLPPSATVYYFDQAQDLEDSDSAANYDLESKSGYINTETSDDETRFYVSTFVSAYGEESAPSSASNETELYCDKDSVSLLLGSAPQGAQNITHRRIYRTASTSDITSFFLVAEIPVNQSTYTDTRPTSALGAELTTQEYDKPPEDLEGLILSSTGAAIGFVGNTIVPSEPALPYAFPVAYRQALPDTIMGLAEMSGGIVIATDNKPAIMTGSMPDAFTITVIDAAYPCVSKRSLVDMGESALYASHDGLVSISQGGAKLLSQPVLSKEYWHSLKPETIHAYRWNNYYVAFYDERAGFMVDLRTGDYYEISTYASAGYFDSVTGQLMVVVDGAFKAFGTGDNTQYRWVSRDFDVRSHTLSWLKVNGLNLTDTQLVVTCDGVTLIDVALTGSDPAIRLPPFRAERLSFSLQSTDTIEGVVLASSAEELRSA